MTPTPNDDGSYYTHTVKKYDSFSGIRAAHALTVDKVEGFSKKTWG